MNAEQAGASSWGARRWLLMLVLVFVMQLALILAMGERKPVHRRSVGPSPALRFAGDSGSELLALADPTIFALPHRDGFSGPAWIQIKPMEIPSFAWSEPPEWLTLSVDSLKQKLLPSHDLVSSRSIVTALQPDPSLVVPALPPLRPGRLQSSVELRGDLANRRLLTQLVPPAITNLDIVTNSVVQLVVDADGNPISVTPVPASPGSGLSEMDKLAAELARKTRFAPIAGDGPRRIPDALSHLTVGQLIFQWQTVAPPIVSTNVPAQ